VPCRAANANHNLAGRILKRRRRKPIPCRASVSLATPISNRETRGQAQSLPSQVQQPTRPCTSVLRRPALRAAAVASLPLLGGPRSGRLLLLRSRSWEGRAPGGCCCSGFKKRRRRSSALPEQKARRRAPGGRILIRRRGMPRLSPHTATQPTTTTITPADQDPPSKTQRHALS
jgi:hypothetical protein